VTANPKYRDKAHWFKKSLGETPGLDVAADIIEGLFAQDSGVRTKPGQKAVKSTLAQGAGETSEIVQTLSAQSSQNSERVDFYPTLADASISGAIGSHSMRHRCGNRFGCGT
jgi:hypothetical protein